MALHECKQLSVYFEVWKKIKRIVCRENEFNCAYISIDDGNNGPYIILYHHPVDISFAVPVIMDKADVSPFKIKRASKMMYMRRA